MHNQWEELIPFYIASTLPIRQARALESHLASCETCRQSVEQWRAIAGAVKEEATAQSRGLPPLSPQVRHTIATQRPRYDATLFRRPASFWHPSYVAVAAAAAILIATGVLAVLMSRAAKTPTRQGSSISALFTPTATPRDASKTPQVTTEASATGSGTIQQDFGIVTPTTTFINTPRPSTTPIPSMTPIPLQKSAQPTEVPTTSASFSLSNDSTCTITSTSPDGVAAMRLPDVNSGIAGYLQANVQQPVIVQVGGGWYEIFLPDIGAIGWVSDTTVTLNGPCNAVPFPTPTMISIDDGLCYVASASGNAVNIYAGPGTSYAILNSFASDQRPDAMDVSDNGWYRVNHWIGSTLWIGWVSPGDVYTSGNCNNLGLIPSAGYPPEHSPLETPTLPPATPTAGLESAMRSSGFNLILLADAGTIPTGTRVAIGSAYYDGTSWFYGIYTQEGIGADSVPESQLTYAP